MRFAFILDPLDHLKAYKDSSVAMMRETVSRGHEVHALEAREMTLTSGSVVAPVRRVELLEGEAWYRASAPVTAKLSSFDVVMMRKDPPFDQEYYYATLLLDRVEAEGARVVNRPRALRDWNEKLAILRFPQFTPDTLVASDPEAIQAFIAKHGDVIVKKLDGMGGTMIFRVRSDDANRNVIVETMTEIGRASCRERVFVGV